MALQLSLQATLEEISVCLLISLLYFLIKMNIKSLLIVPLFALACFTSKAQDYGGFYFGVKGGLLLGIQKWNNFDRDPLVKYHGIAFIESLDPSGSVSLFAQAGLHRKGSAIRGRNFIGLNNEPFRAPTQEFIFNNISLTVGGKMKNYLSESSTWHYLFGLRGDYTISTNLDEYERLNELTSTLFFPTDGFVRKINYGVTLGGGFEFDLSEMVGALLEFTINPDFSNQYRQPSINTYNPITRTSGATGERTIRNTTFEVTVGFRFLRKVEYID